MAIIPIEKKKKDGIPVLAGLPASGVKRAAQRSIALNNRTMSKTPVNPGNQPWSQVDNSRLDTRDSTVKSIMRSGPKGQQLESVDVDPWTTEEQARFNRPVGEYRKVNRPGMIRRGSANSGGDVYGADFSMGQDNQSMPDFSRGGSRANKAVQRSNEAKWLMARGQGADAMNLARVRGGQQSADTAMRGAAQTNIAQIQAGSASERNETQRQIAEANLTAEQLSATALGKAKASQADSASAMKRTLAADKAYSEYVNSATGIGKSPMTRQAFDAQMGYGGKSEAESKPSFFSDFQSYFDNKAK